MGGPLSIAAGVAGILTAAGHVSSLLINFIKNTESAPQDARTVLADVSETSVILSSLQLFLLGTEVADRSRTSHLQVDHVVVIVTGCVSTFSELEALLDGLKSEQMGLLDRFKLSVIGQQLLMLDRSNMEAVLGSVDGLRNTVNESYSDILTKLEKMEQHQACQQSNPSSVFGEAIEDSAITTTIKGVSHEEGGPPQVFRFAFDTDLWGSRVYRKIPYGVSSISLHTRSAHITSWSILSGLSMADMSQVSVLSLAIGLKEVYNPTHYMGPASHDHPVRFRLADFGHLYSPELS
ncbi:hypothetical protein MMC30_008164 [Trapelia coarctata]|nr:hypothetical protein [Trapelia coarctata]